MRTISTCKIILLLLLACHETIAQRQYVWLESTKSKTTWIDECQHNNSYNNKTSTWLSIRRNCQRIALRPDAVAAIVNAYFAFDAAVEVIEGLLILDD